MRQAEGQPRLKLIQSIRRIGERFVQRVNPPLTYKEYLHQTGGHFISHVYGDILAPSDRDYITRTYDAYLMKTHKKGVLTESDRNYLIERQLEGLLPPLGTHEEWMKYIALRERLEQEAAARGDPNIDYSQLPWQPQPRKYEDLTPDEQKYQNITAARELSSRMATTAQFDQIAESIQERLWNDNSFFPHAVAIEPTKELKIGIKKDGTITNRSRFGATISYTHKDTEVRSSKVVRIPQKEELSFGIGYFGERADLIPDAQALVTDEELRTGVRAYYVQWSYTTEEHRRIVRHTKSVAIPISSPDSMQKFFENLYVGAKLVSPDAVIPQAKRRARTYRRNRRFDAAA